MSGIDQLDELDFTGPAREPLPPPPPVAPSSLNLTACFEAHGRAEPMADGAAYFKEGDASDRMYLLLEGEVTLLRGGRTLDIVKAGEIFGEVATITGQSRSASAVARGACKAISLDREQLQLTLKALPEFALLLMRVLNSRLRLTLALLRRGGSITVSAVHQATVVFDKKLLKELSTALHDKPAQKYPGGRAVMKEGESGVSMYLVVSGQVAIWIKGTLVERAGPGTVFGEMALVDQSPRVATAVMEDDGTMLAINRSEFLALVQSHPNFATALLRAIAERLRYVTAQKK
jgi:CRP/FNR family transcriptional regulator, cyclic AMP receptor protein